jgi:hypothetical protein
MKQFQIHGGVSGLLSAMVFLFLFGCNFVDSVVPGGESVSEDVTGVGGEELNDENRISDNESEGTTAPELTFLDIDSAFIGESESESLFKNQSESEEGSPGEIIFVPFEFVEIAMDAIEMIENMNAILFAEGAPILTILEHYAPAVDNPLIIQPPAEEGRPNAVKIEIGDTFDYTLRLLFVDAADATLYHTGLRIDYDADGSAFELELHPSILDNSDTESPYGVTIAVGSTDGGELFMTIHADISEEVSEAEEPETMVFHVETVGEAAAFKSQETETADPLLAGSGGAYFSQLELGDDGDISAEGWFIFGITGVPGYTMQKIYVTTDGSIEVNETHSIGTLFSGLLVDELRNNADCAQFESFLGVNPCATNLDLSDETFLDVHLKPYLYENCPTEDENLQELCNAAELIDLANPIFLTGGTDDYATTSTIDAATYQTYVDLGIVAAYDATPLTTPAALTAISILPEELITLTDEDFDVIISGE